MKSLQAILLLLSIASTASLAAELFVRADSPCTISVDGKRAAKLGPDQELKLRLRPGRHSIEAVSSAGGNSWRQSIEIASSATRQKLSIPLHETTQYWIDPETKLIWTLADNGSGLSWHQAQRYCRELALAGFRDWALPSIEELQGVFDSSQNQNNGGFHLRGPLKLTGWQWSATAGVQEGEGWAFDFGDGGRASVAAGDSGLNRALCVRRAQ